MKRERTRAIAWIVSAVSLLSLLAAVALSFVQPSEAQSFTEDSLGFTILIVVFVSAGAVIATRVRSNRVGWLYITAGLLGSLFMLLGSATNTAKLMGWGGWELLGALANALYFPWIFSMVVFPALLFPDGRLPSRRWRVVAWAALLFVGTWVGAAVVGPAYEPDVAGMTVVAEDRIEMSEGILTLWPVDGKTDADGESQSPVAVSEDYGAIPSGGIFFRSDSGDRYVTVPTTDLNDNGTVPNPIHVEALAGLFSIIGPLGLIFLVVAMGGTIASVVVRFRRSEGVERLQMKWLAFSAAIAGFGLLANYVIGAFYPDWWALEVFILVGLLGTLMIPITTAMAIVRYRLYDIDRLISRTVVYGLLVALLAGVYVGAVFLFSQLLPNDNSITVAISTLAVAALFNPFRRGIQRVIDRRLHRAQYDAQQVVDDFSGRLSHGIDIDSIEDELLVVLDETVQPEVAGLWIRQPED